VIRSFANRGTADIFDGSDSTAAKRTCPQRPWSVARRKIDQVNRVHDLGELATPPGNRLERLKGKRAGQYGIRINEQYRICFHRENDYADDVEITAYH
jgi:proteic killer suppression protein